MCVVMGVFVFVLALDGVKGWLVGWVCMLLWYVCAHISIIITLNDYQQIVSINLLPYRIMNSELNSSVVHESFEFSDSDTTISSSSISLPVNGNERDGQIIWIPIVSPI